MDSHLLNTRDDFFLMSSQVHSYSSQIPEKQPSTQTTYLSNSLLTNKEKHDAISNKKNDCR